MTFVNVFASLFQDKDVGAEAKKIYGDAEKMLAKIISRRMIKAKGIIGIFPCNSIGDDIEIYAPDGHTLLTTLFGLRQQAYRDTGDRCLCISDYVAPKDSGITDYIGIFIVSAGFGVEEVCKKMDTDLNDYDSIMFKALADRLAEAFAGRVM